MMPQKSSWEGKRNRGENGFAEALRKTKAWI